MNDFPVVAMRLRYEFGGLIQGGSYFWIFMVFTIKISKAKNSKTIK